MDLAGKRAGVGLLKHLNISARHESESRYTEHNRLARNRCPKQSSNTEWRQRARCYRHWNFSKGWKLSSDTQQLCLHSNLAFLNSVVSFFPCIFRIIMQDDRFIPWRRKSEENLTNSIDLLNWYIQYLLALKLSHLCVKVLRPFDQIFYRRAWAWNSPLFTVVCALCEAEFKFRLQTFCLWVSCTFLESFSLNLFNFKCWSNQTTN